MLRSWICMALLAIVFAVGSSDAANCTKTTFTEQLAAAELAAKKLIAEKYATSTKEQIIKKFLEDYHETVISFTFTIVEKGDDCQIEYQIILACNETTTKTLSDGSKQTSQVVSKVNKQQAEKTIKTVLTDRANEVSAAVEQKKSGITEVTCHFNVGGANYYEWYLEISSSAYTSAYASGSFKSVAEFHQSLEKLYYTQLLKVYSNQISNVKFVSAEKTSDGKYKLTFRIEFKSDSWTEQDRTACAQHILDVLKIVVQTYFKSVSSKMDMSKSITIETPKPVNTVSKKAIVISSKDSSKSILTGKTHNATLVSSSKTSSKSKSGSSNKTKTGTGSSSSSSFNKTYAKSSGTSKNSSKTVKTSGSSIKSSSTNKTQSVKKSKGGEGSSSEKKSKSYSKSRNVTKTIGGKGSSSSQSANKSTTYQSGKSGNKTKTTTTEKKKSAGGKYSFKAKNGSDTSDSADSKESSKDKTVGSGANKSVNRTKTSTKQKTKSADGKYSFKVKSSNSTSGSAGSKESSKGEAKGSAKGKSGNTTRVDNKQKTKSAGGKYSFKVKGSNSTSGSTNSKESSKGKAKGSGKGKSGNTTETIIKQKTKTAGGKYSFKLESSNNTSGSTGSKESSKGKAKGSGKSKSGNATKTNNKQKTKITGVSKQSSKNKTIGSGNNQSANRTKTITKQKTKSAGGKYSFKIKSSNSTSGSTGSKESSKGKAKGSGKSKSGNTTKTNNKQKTKITGGSKQLSKNKTVGSGSNKSVNRTKTITKQKTKSAGGKYSFKIKSSNSTSGSTGSKESSKGNAKGSGKGKSGNTTRVDNKQKTKTVNGSKQSSKNKTVNVYKTKKPNRGNGTTGTRAPKKSYGTKAPGKTNTKKVSKTKQTKSPGYQNKPTKKNTKAPGSNVKPTKSSDYPTGSGPTQTSAPRKAGVYETPKKAGGPKASRPANKGKGKGKGKNVDVIIKPGVVFPKLDVGKPAPSKKSPNGPVISGKITNTVSRGNKKLTLKSLTKTKGQPQGTKVMKLPKDGEPVFFGRTPGIANRKPNIVRDVIDENSYDQPKNAPINKKQLNTFLAFLLSGRGSGKKQFGRHGAPACPPRDVYVNYIYEFDIYNQVFNSSFQDPNSVVIRGLQNDIAEWTAAEICKLNLISYVIDKARLVKIADVSKKFNDQATIRFSVSINVNKRLIGEFARLLENIGKKVQNERFSTSNKKVDWGSMVLIPITK